ncbi:MAG: TIGR02444 family protein [Cellvibrionaceae bacterium]
MSIKPASSLWDFAIDLYNKPGVETTCLQLQDEHGFDIPLLLFCCWAGWRYGAVSVEQLQPVINFSQEWSEQNIQPLRDMRRAMKYGYSQQWPVDQSDYEDLRQQVKKAELMSERFLLEGLEKLTDQWGVSSRGGESYFHNVNLCFPSMDFTEGLLSQQIKTLLASIAQVSAP